MKSNMTFSYDSRPILTLNNDINNSGRQGGIDLQPSYQRGHVWNADFKNKLIYSIIRQFPIDNITLRVNNGIREVVDGQQRLTTISDFVNDRLYVTGEYAKETIKYISQYLMDKEEDDPKLNKLVKRLENKTGAKFKFSNLPLDIQNNIQAYNVFLTSIANAKDDELLNTYNFYKIKKDYVLVKSLTHFLLLILNIL